VSRYPRRVGFPGNVRLMPAYAGIFFFERRYFAAGISHSLRVQPDARPGEERPYYCDAYSCMG
jgi:hypothetical protein